METDTTRGFNPNDRRADPFPVECPEPLATVVRADRAAHDVAQTTLGEFDGEVTLYPEIQ